MVVRLRLFLPLFAIVAAGLLLSACSMSSAVLFFTSPLLKVLGVTGALGVACIAVWFLAPAWLPINRTHLLWAGIALLTAGAFYAWAFEAGQDHMAQRVAAKDQEAVARVGKATSKVAECDDSGGQWDATSGTCSR